MSTTLLKNKRRGADPSKLTSCEQRFILELLALGMSNIAEAVRKAYPKNRNPAQYGTKLLKRPRIAAILGKLQREDAEKLEIDRLETLRQLWYALTRKIEDFADSNGFPLTPGELPAHCQSIVDGYKVKVLKRWTEEDGAEVELQSIEYRLTPHAVAREQAMKHKGLFAAEEHNVNVSLQEFLERLSRPVEVDQVESRLEQERKLLEYKTT